MPTTLPPGPPLPSVAQLFLWLYRPARFFEACHARYGDLFTMRLPGNAPRVMLARHEEIRAVFTGDAASLHAGAANALVAPLVGPRSVLILDGPAHQRQRRLLLSLFNGRNAARQGETMRALTEAMIQALPVEVELDLAPALQALTLRIIVVTIFGVDDPSRVQALASLLTALLEQAKSPLLLVPVLQRDLGPITPWRGFQRLNADLDAALRPLIAQRRDAPGDDLLSQLVTATDERGQPLSAGQIRDDLVTLLVAGHETTASALAWTLSLVLGDAEIRARAEAELEEVVGQAPLEVHHLDSLVWLGACIDEAMRLSPVLAHVGRLLTAPMPLGAYTLPAGVMVVPNIYLAHRDPRLYPEPDRYEPRRFLARPPSPHAYLPFGGGARRCVGMTFALQEMKIVLGTFFSAPLSPARPGPRPSVRQGASSGRPAGRLVRRSSASMPLKPGS
ncbi:MAG: cytochrome P450 [Deltaproteobacteria bacterium]|nr:cytochrome P450 [Deltaproteobacteria bacterium]